MALPFLDSMLPSLAQAAPASGVPAAPVRMAFVYVRVLRIELRGI